MGWGRPLLRQHGAERIAWPAFGDFAHLFHDVIDDTAAYRQPWIGRMDCRGLLVGDNVSKKPEVDSDAGTYQHGQWATTLGDAVGGVTAIASQTLSTSLPPALVPYGILQLGRRRRFRSEQVFAHRDAGQYRAGLSRQKAATHQPRQRGPDDRVPGGRRASCAHSGSQPADAPR